MSIAGIGADFQDSGADEAERDPFVLPLDHRVQRHGGADAGEGNDYLQNAAEDGASVRPDTDDVIRTLHRTAESEGRDRDKRDQVEHTRGKRGLSV
jgi:hypothetical protein